MSQPVQDQQTVLDWEQFFRDHRRIDRVALTLVTPRMHGEPGLSVEVTICRGSREDPQASEKVTISANAPVAGDGRSLAVTPHYVHELAEMLDEAHLLGYELRGGLDRSQRPRTTGQRRKKPAATVSRGAEVGEGAA